MLNYYLLGVLELRFRGGELCRGRGDGEHDSILYRVCVFMKRFQFLVRLKRLFQRERFA